MASLDNGVLREKEIEGQQIRRVKNIGKRVEKAMSHGIEFG